MDVRKTKSLRYQKNPNKLAWHFSLVGQEDVCLQSNICLISNEVAERERKKFRFEKKGPTAKSIRKIHFRLPKNKT